MGLGDSGRSKTRVFKLLQVNPIVPDSGIPGKSLHVNRTNGIRRDPQSYDHVQQANPLEDNLPVRPSRFMQRFAKGRQIEPIHIAPISAPHCRVTVCTHEIRIEGLRELSCQKGLTRPTEPIDADDASLRASRVDPHRKGIDIREVPHSARSPQFGLVNLRTGTMGASPLTAWLGNSSAMGLYHSIARKVAVAS